MLSESAARPGRCHAGERRRAPGAGHHLELADAVQGYPHEGNQPFPITRHRKVFHQEVARGVIEGISVEREVRGADRHTPVVEITPLLGVEQGMECPGAVAPLQSGQCLPTPFGNTPAKAFPELVGIAVQAEVDISLAGRRNGAPLLHPRPCRRRGDPYSAPSFHGTTVVSSLFNHQFHFIGVRLRRQGLSAMASRRSAVFFFL